MAYIGSSPTKVVSRQSANIFTYTATANQTAFTGADANGNTLACSPSDIMVHMNGIKLEESDYTATTTTVTLGSGAAAGDEVTITAFLTFESADHYTKSAADTRYVNTTGDTMSGDLTIDTNTFHVDVADNRVGIGITTPAQPLHVFKAGSQGGGMAPLIKVQNDTNNLTGDGSGIEFHGKYQGGEWGFGKIGGTNAGGNFGGALEFHTNTGTGSVSTGFTKKMTIDRNGYVTTPYQPSWNLRPNASTTTTVTNSIIGWTTNTTGSSSTMCHIQGVTLSGSSSGAMGATSSGRINFPVGGKYKVWITVRCENTPGAGNIYLNHNGTTVARQHVEVWNRYNYAHGFHSQVINVAANDYIEFTISVSSGNISGYNDTVNWCGGYLIG